MTVAAYALARHGLAVLEPGVEPAALIPASIQRVAVAIETMHKASLVHDDIEDDDAFRYGQPTLHRTYGVASAINVGDYLLGIGYRLIAGEAPAIGAQCVTDLLTALSAAHLALCRGQGAELLWQRQPKRPASHRCARHLCFEDGAGLRGGALHRIAHGGDVA